MMGYQYTKPKPIDRYKVVYAPNAEALERLVNEAYADGNWRATGGIAIMPALGPSGRIIYAQAMVRQ